MKNIKKNIGIVFGSFMKVFTFRRWIVIVSASISLFLAVQSSVSAILSGEIVNSLAHLKMTSVLIFASLIVLFQYAGVLLNIAQSYLNSVLSQRFNVHTNKELIERIESMEILEKEDPRFGGNLNIWTHATGRYYNIYQTLVILTQSVLSGLLNLSYLFFSQWILALIVVFTSVLKGIIHYRIVKIRIETTRELERNSREHDYLFRLLLGSDTQKELALFKSFNYFKEQWLLKKNDALNKKLKLEIKENKLSITESGLSSISVGIITFIIIYLISRGTLTVGEYITLTMLAGIADMNIQFTINRLASLIEDAKHIEHMQSMNIPFDQSTKGLLPFMFEQELHLKDITFYYPNSLKAALNGVSGKVLKGQKIVILGDNAAGKSTLVKVILGLYRLQIGNLFYDKVSIDTIDSDKMRDKTGAVFQDFIRYMGSIRDNVVAGRNHKVINDMEVLEILKLLGFKDRDFPNGLDTQLGYLSDNAINLSGGQWQRLALARILLRDDDLLVLDEPTAALDPLSEMTVYDKILELKKDKTVFIISHRIGMARKADQIWVMKDGEIIERGTHQQLLEKHGFYNQMWLQQSEWYQLTDKGDSVNGDGEKHEARDGSGSLTS